jgi:AAA domain
MKEKERICDTCGISYKFNKASSKYCSPACRVEAYRERNEIERPSFLGTTKKEIFNSEIQDVEWEFVEVTKEVEKKIKNPDYEIISENLNESNRVAIELKERHKILTAEYYNILKTAELLPFGTAGVGIIGGAMISKNDDVLGKLITIGAMALGGGLLGKALSEALKQSMKNKVLNIENEMNRLNIEFTAISIQIESLIDSKKQIKEYLIVKELIKERVKKRKYSPNTEPKEQTQVNIQQLSNMVLNRQIDGVTANEIVDMEFATLNFIEPYKSFLGEISEPFSMMVYGTPGAGKSSFALQFSHYLASHFGKVLVISTEEGVNKSMQNKIIEFRLQSNNLIFATQIGNIKEANLIGYRFILIDSVNDAKLSADDLKQLRLKYPKSCFILVFQSTKDGDFKGGQQYLHDADIKIRVENGKASTEKNRFDSVGKQLTVYNTATESI